MLERPEKGDSEEAVTFRWKKAEGQEAWIKIGLAFLMFYFGEAVLFWQGGPTLAAPLVKFPLAVPLMYPLGYWGLFGASIFFILRKNSSSYNRSAMDKRFSRWQGGLLTLCITVGVVGVAFTVVEGSGSTTLGHVALFFAMFLAAGVIGAIELNVGWLAAAVVWLLTALAINVYPKTLSLVPRFKDEDILIGLAMTIGFLLIGVYPQHVDREGMASSDGNRGGQQQDAPDL